MIYLNQASTTYPKPEQVINAVTAAITLPPFSQGRSSTNGDSLDVRSACRQKLAQLFHIKNQKRIYFTSGATDAFNRIVRGLELEQKKVVVTQTEHNAVLRPLYNICKNTEIAIAKCDKEGSLSLSELKNQIDNNTAAVFVNHCSNVTGIVLPLEEIGKIVHEKGALLIVDVSQSAGIFDIDVEKMGIDILAFTGHKGLYGPQGTGGFYIRPGIYLRPSVYGGTGHDSRRLVVDDAFEEHEAGTQNLHGLYGLCAGIDFVMETGLSTIRKKEQELMSVMKQGLLDIKKVRVYGANDSVGSLVSFNLHGIRADDAAYILANSYDLVLRSGFHCAPLIHQALGCEEHGTIRASVSYFNTFEEIEKFLDAVAELEQSL